MYNNTITFKANTSLPSNEIGEEFIILDSSRKKAHELNSLGKSIWKILENEKTFKELKSSLMDEFEIDEATLGKDVTTFLEDLIEKELITTNE